MSTSQKIKVANLVSFNMSDGEKLAKNAHIIANVIDMIFTMAILGLLYQAIDSIYTFQLGGTTDCKLFYELSLHTWIYLVWAFNVIDLRLSANVGDKLWGRLTLFSNIVFFGINWIIIGGMFLIYAINANQDGQGGLPNIASSPYVCGNLVYLSNPDNNCVWRNPTLTASLPLVDMTMQTLHPDFINMVVLMIMVALLKSVKLFCILFVPDSTSMLNDITKAVSSELSNSDGSGSGSLQPFCCKKVKMARGTLQNIYQRMDFFEIYLSWETAAYIPAEFFDLVIGGLTITWFGWFQQRLGTYLYRFVYSTVPSPHTTLVHTMVSGWLYIFYALLTLIILVWVLNAHIQDMSANIYSVIGSLFGVIVSGVFFIVILVFWFSCNHMGSFGWNLCTSRMFCLITAYSSNPLSGCEFSYPCPDSLNPALLTWNPHYTALFVYITWTLISCIGLSIWTVYSQKRIGEYIVSSAENRRLETLAINQGLADKLEPVQMNYQPVPSTDMNSAPTNLQGQKKKHLKHE